MKQRDIKTLWFDNYSSYYCKYIKGKKISSIYIKKFISSCHEKSINVQNEKYEVKVQKRNKSQHSTRFVHALESWPLPQREYCIFLFSKQDRIIFFLDLPNGCLTWGRHMGCVIQIQSSEKTKSITKRWPLVSI